MNKLLNCMTDNIELVDLTNEEINKLLERLNELKELIKGFNPEKIEDVLDIRTSLYQRIDFLDMYISELVNI